MSNLSDLVIATAKGEVGYHEGRSGGHWNNREKYAAQVPGLAWVSAGGYPWCAVFVSWCAMKAGAADLFPRTASTDNGAAWFKAKGQWSEYPAVGAQVFFGHGGDMSHTGIVYAYDADFVYTVEGNTNTDGSAEGDGVYLKKRLRRDDFVQGYGYPAYPGGIKSADPAHPGHVAPAPPPAPVPAPPAPKSAGTNVESAIKSLNKAKHRATKPSRIDALKKALAILKGLRR